MTTYSQRKFWIEVDDFFSSTNVRACPLRVILPRQWYTVPKVSDHVTSIQTDDPLFQGIGAGKIRYAFSRNHCRKGRVQDKIPMSKKLHLDLSKTFHVDFTVLVAALPLPAC